MEEEGHPSHATGGTCSRMHQGRMWLRFVINPALHSAQSNLFVRGSHSVSMVQCGKPFRCCHLIEPACLIIQQSHCEAMPSRFN